MGMEGPEGFAPPPPPFCLYFLEVFVTNCNQHLHELEFFIARGEGVVGLCSNATISLTPLLEFSGAVSDGYDCS